MNSYQNLACQLIFPIETVCLQQASMSWQQTEPEPRSQMQLSSSCRVSLIHRSRSFLETKQAESMRPISASLVMWELYYRNNEQSKLYIGDALTNWVMKEGIRVNKATRERERCLVIIIQLLCDNDLHIFVDNLLQQLLISMQSIQPIHSSLPQPQSSQESNSHSPTQLKIVTLNYCGIMNNPFQFYCDTYLQELHKLSEVFQRLVREHFKLEKEDKFRWEMGKIEQKIRLGRYSPSFHLNIGIENGKFLGREEFQKRWNEEFKAICEKGQLKFEEAHISNTRTYDFLFYSALLRYVYQQESFEQLIKQDPAKYVANLKKFYDLSYLDDAKKMVIVQNSLLQFGADIIFLQEFSPLFLTYIKDHPQYEHVTDVQHDTIIAVKKASFLKIVETGSVLSKQQIESLMWTEKTSIMVADNLILINAHLSSKKEKNLPQIDLLKKTLLRLKQQLPGYHIILGGDLNSFLSPDEEFDQHFHMYPRLSNEITTVKMRTMAQGQFEKANIKTAESKDKIITDLPIVADSAKVSYIDNIHSPEENSYVPTNEHPFDHFLVTCRVALH